MAAQTLTATLALRYVGAANATVNSALVVAVPYNALEEGLVDIPNLTAEGTEFPVAFGSVGNVTAVFVNNTGDQDLAVKLNGETNASYRIAAGSGQLIAMPTAAGAQGAQGSQSGARTPPLTAVSLYTTAAQASSVGGFEYIVFGS